MMTKNANGGIPGKKAVETAKKTDKPLTPQQVKKIVGDINRLYVTVGKGQLEIGDFVLNQVFQGSLDEASSRDPYKNKSMALVCGHVDLNVNRRRLGEYVRVAYSRKELIAHNEGCSNLIYSHFAALLQVKDAKERNKLAVKASKGQWSVHKLAEEIGKKKTAKADNGKKQDTGQPSVGIAEQLMQILCNPLALMKDEEVKKMLANPEAIKVQMPLSAAIQLAEVVDELITSMFESAKLLEEAKENIALAYMRKGKAMNG
jgi:hypothetical protein